MSSKHLKVLWPVSLTLAVSLGVWALVAGRSKGSWEHKEIGTPINVSPAPMQNGIGPRALDPVQNIRFTLYDAGILPRELHLDKGLVSITVEDRTRQSTGLVIQREVGNAQIVIGQVQRFTNHWRGRGEVRLTPGTYLISDASRPANRAKLVVAP
jgi:hypothetical protein